MPVDSVPEHISQNIDGILAFYRREERKISDSQRLLEIVGGFMRRPSYLASVVSFVALWMLANALCKLLGFQPPDPPPFVWLQAIVSLGALLTATVVLITQNREARLEAQRLELELQVNLLTEQKTTKLILLLEELRRDLPWSRIATTRSQRRCRNQRSPKNCLPPWRNGVTRSDDSRVSSSHPPTKTIVSGARPDFNAMHH
jgi:uncharacterized membrane protein